VAVVTKSTARIVKKDLSFCGELGTYPPLHEKFMIGPFSPRQMMGVEQLEWTACRTEWIFDGKMVEISPIHGYSS
jgi:hypothetical protein